MGILGNLMTAIGAGCGAFRASILNNDPQQGGGAPSRGFGEWDLWQARVARYDLYWALYQNNAYKDFHRWAPGFKLQAGASTHIRHLYNPAARVVDFYAAHLQGGLLDERAGDGHARQSALPILADDPAIRPPIARLWKDSRWQVLKEVYTRWGAALGDVGIKLVDDTTEGQVRMEVVHPGHLKWVDFDPVGNVTAYILQKWVYDPRGEAVKDAGPDVDPRSGRRLVRYTEKAYLDAGRVYYQTLLDGLPYAWNGEDSAWDEAYGFVPLVVAHHKPTGTQWAENAFHCGLSRFVEVDDQASCLSDGNRRDLAAPHYITGVKSFDATGTATAGDASRDDQNFLFGPNGSTAIPLTTPRDLKGMCEHITLLLDDIEKNFPELLADSGDLGGRVTAEAIRNARQRASAQVQARRVGYDGPLADAQKMAIAIGGFRKYRGYEGLGLDDLKAGRLDHSIGHRTVFEVDPLDSINEDQAFWTAATMAVGAGVPLSLYLERNGWSEEDLATLARARAAEPTPVAVRPPAMVPGDNFPSGATK